MFSRIIRNTRTYLFTATALAALTLGSTLSTTAFAYTPNGGPDQDGYRDRDRDRDGDRDGDDDRDFDYDRHNASEIALHNGFRAGYREGREDAYRGYGFNIWRDDVYRDASWGYDGRCGNFRDYQRAFRAGFQRGYTIAYRQFYNDRRRGGIHISFGG